MSESKKSTKKSKSVETFGDIDRSTFSLVEVTLLKDHGADKKDDVIKRHPNTADLLIERGIAKK